jgi:TfoX/Sxy family transcriptional regulator of competence genes
MAQPYLDQLTHKLSQWKVATPRSVTLECRHFFSGAALYANGRIVASLTRVGLALKLPDATCARLFRNRKARRLRYFAHGPVKKDYAVLARKVTSNNAEVRALLRSSIQFVRGRLG